ncbi:MAG: HigA family addiction module antidote protein [Bacteroidales bacterium]|nr:HigA family addiction module antidote protein [Candidatus Minthousia equi]
MITLNNVDANMIANNLHPAEPTHPGEVIKDEIEYLGITQKQLAEGTGISYSVINEVLNGKRQVSMEYALLFEAALDIDAETLVRMQMRYNRERALRDNAFLSHLKSVQKIAASVAL